MWAQLAALDRGRPFRCQAADQDAGGHGREPQVSKSWRGPYVEGNGSAHALADSGG